MRTTSASLAALLFAIAATSAAAQPAAISDSTRSTPTSIATRTAGEIRLDGKLDESEWAQAPATTQFTQSDPEEGKPATQPMEVRVLYDDTYLYVGARMQDIAAPRARLGRRDMDPGDSDWFKVFLDSYHDRRTAFGFEVNPAGVRRDETRTIDFDDNSWDPVWDVATSSDATGWTAEMRIPFSQLRFSREDRQTWGLQFERVNGRTNEVVSSTFIPKSERGGVPYFGHLEGIEGLRAGRRLELLPYTVGKSEFVDRTGNPFREFPENRMSGGLDLLYGVTSNLTLNAAFNPDFGQVEVDPAVVNLGVYETFFDEKRPFFIEGSEIFDFGADGTSGGQIFYSRRIGRAPTLGGLTPSAERNVPEVTTILGAGKLTGKTHGWSLGVLEAVTAREEARYRTGGVDGDWPVEPLSNYFVTRARRESRGGQSIYGGILTSTVRSLDWQGARDFLHEAAYAGGVDFRHEWGKRMWAAYGDAELSHVQGTSSAITATQRRSNHFFQRPDADHLEVDPLATSLTGYSVNLQVRKQGGKHWRTRLGTAVTSPKYETNDLGFSFRTDRRDFQHDLTYLQNTPGKLWRRWNVGLTNRFERNYDWQPIQTFTTISAFTTSLSYWSLNANVTRYYRALDDRLTRGGPLATRPARWAGLAGFSSDFRKPVTAGINISATEHESGSWDRSAAISLGLKTSPRWNLTLTPNVTRVHSEAQFVGSVANGGHVATYGRDYVFAPLDQTQVGLETRFNFTFTPRLSLETYLQPLLSSGDYGNAKMLAAASTYDFAPYSLPTGSFDFNLRSLRGNAVLRWEWRPGSTLYAAWQQQRQDIAPFGEFDLSRDSSALLDTRPDNIYLVKVNYWFDV